MTKIHVKGTIISDRVQRIYDWVGIQATSPSKVIESLPTNQSNVEVVINSGGGDVFAGSEIYTALKEYPGKVTVKVVGLAASAASVIAMAGDKVLISPTAQMMVHNVSTSASGDYRNFEHTAEVLKSANQSIANAYKAKTGKSDDEIKALMDSETWFNASSAIENGFADEEMFSESQEPTLIADFGGMFLDEDAIDRIMAVIETPKSPQQTLGNEVLVAQLNLLKLKGGVHL